MNGQKITDAQLDDWFTYHAPTLEQAARYQMIRAGARQFATALVEPTNAAIACEKKS